VDGYRFRVVAPGTCVGERHSHGVQTQASPTEIAEMGALHEPVAMVVGCCRAGPVTATVVNVAAANSAGNVADSIRATPRSFSSTP